MKKLIIDESRFDVLSPTKNAFASLMRSIIYQQLSTSAAASIEKKFFALFFPEALTATRKQGIPIGKKFPKPEEVLKLSDVQFQSAGVSAQKRAYLRDLATKFSDGTIVPKQFPKMSDEEIIEHLVRVKGVGVWTAHMFLIFALNRPNVLPVGDLAIKKGFRVAFALREDPTEKKMQLLARPYEGKHTTLALHLWGLMDAAKEKKKIVKKKKLRTIVKK